MLVSNELRSIKRRVVRNLFVLKIATINLLQIQFNFRWVVRKKLYALCKAFELGSRELDTQHYLRLFELLFLLCTSETTNLLRLSLANQQVSAFRLSAQIKSILNKLRTNSKRRWKSSHNRSAAIITFHYCLHICFMVVKSASVCLLRVAFVCLFVWLIEKATRLQSAKILLLCSAIFQRKKLLKCKKKIAQAKSRKNGLQFETCCAFQLKAFKNNQSDFAKTRRLRKQASSEFQITFRSQSNTSQVSNFCKSVQVRKQTSFLFLVHLLWYLLLIDCSVAG